MIALRIKCDMSSKESKKVIWGREKPQSAVASATVTPPSGVMKAKAMSGHKSLNDLSGTRTIPERWGKGDIIQQEGGSTPNVKGKTLQVVGELRPFP